MAFKPLHFIGETVEPQFDTPPLFEKLPGCPARFIWRTQTYEITELLSEWQDYERRGRMSNNMRPEHAARAAQRGSWGVGRSFFRVRTDTHQIFDIYYDRAPGGSEDRKGSWTLFQELAETPEPDRPA